MENLIFYKEGESLRGNIEKIHFSTKKLIQLFFPLHLSDLEGLIESKNIRGLVFILAKEINEEFSHWLKYYSQFDPDLKIALFSDSSEALIAWDIGVFHFEPYPVLSSRILYTYRKYCSFKNQNQQVYSVRSPEGVFNLNIRDINYIQAAGNYTLIQFRNNKNMVLTRQLGTYTDLLETYPDFERVHRSLILNKSAVKKYANQLIYFHHSSKPLEISLSLGAKLKKII